MKISGRVQGVFFRAETRDVARRLMLKGWVKNTIDGCVEVDAEGEDNNIGEFVAWCHSGPQAAHVDNVDVEWSEPTNEFKSFDIRF